MKKILITGNAEKDLCKPTVEKLLENGYYVETLSRTTGWNLGEWDCIKPIVKKADEFDVFINMFANWRFNASLLTYYIFKDWEEKKYTTRRIINVGSTTDRVVRAKNNLYHYEKKALKELSTGLSQVGVWSKAPLVTHFSFGTLENRADDNPGRLTLNFDDVSNYVIWLLNQPDGVHINELSIDPIQQ
jgi:short-subunit dehydrogenase